MNDSFFVCCTDNFTAHCLQGVLCLVPPHFRFKKRFQIIFWHFSSINYDTVNSAEKWQIPYSSWVGGIESTLLMTSLSLLLLQIIFIHIFPNKTWFCQHIQWAYNTVIVAGNVSTSNVILDAALTGYWEIAK